jgi:hypothetical protein
LSNEKGVKKSKFSGRLTFLMSTEAGNGLLGKGVVVNTWARTNDVVEGVGLFVFQAGKCVSRISSLTNRHSESLKQYSVEREMGPSKCRLVKVLSFEGLFYTD